MIWPPKDITGIEPSVRARPWANILFGGIVFSNKNTYWYNKCQHFIFLDHMFWIWFSFYNLSSIWSYSINLVIFHQLVIFHSWSRFLRREGAWNISGILFGTLWRCMWCRHLPHHPPLWNPLQWRWTDGPPSGWRTGVEQTCPHLRPLGGMAVC